MKRIIFVFSIILMSQSNIYAQVSKHYFSTTSSTFLNSDSFTSVGESFVLSGNSGTGIVYLFWDDFTTSTSDIVVTKELKIIPNPASTSIRISNSLEANRMVISNLEGRKIMEMTLNHQEEQSFDVRNFEDGIYFLSLFNDDVLIKVNKFVKN